MSVANLKHYVHCIQFLFSLFVCRSKYSERITFLHHYSFVLWFSLNLQLCLTAYAYKINKTMLAATQKHKAW